MRAEANSASMVEIVALTVLLLSLVVVVAVVVFLSVFLHFLLLQHVFLTVLSESSEALNDAVNSHWLSGVCEDLSGIGDFL